MAPLPIPATGPSASSQALFFDPARRPQGKRIFRVKDYQPPLQTVLDCLPNFSALGVKISPGVDLHALWDFDAEVEVFPYKGNSKKPFYGLDR